jgi:cobalt-zinc-cadmium efflux system outer membrane protein
MKRFFIFLILFTISNTNIAHSTVINVELDELIQIGLEQNQNLKIKRLELEGYKKDIKIANKLKNPEIQSNVVIGNVALGNCSQAGIGLPIEVLKRGIRKKIAEQEYSLKETELRKFEHNFKLQIMQAYFDVLYAKSIYQIQETRLKLFEKWVQITTDREKHSSYEIDNLKADIQYATQKIALNRAHSEMLAKQFELNKVLNTGSEDIMFDTKEASLFAEDWKFLTFKIPDYDFIERTALKYSYMVKISDFNIIKSELELKQAKHQRIPDINLAGGYAWQYHKNTNPHYGGAFVGLGLDLPILYNFTPDIQKADLFLQRSKASKKAYEHQLKYELKKDYNIFKYSAENLKYSKEILSDSKKIVELSTKRYIEGKNSYSDLIVNANAHHEVLTQYLSIISRHFYSYLELMQDIGHDILVDEVL